MLCVPQRIFNISCACSSPMRIRLDFSSNLHTCKLLYDSARFGCLKGYGLSVNNILVHWRFKNFHRIRFVASC